METTQYKKIEGKGDNFEHALETIMNEILTNYPANEGTNIGIK